MAVGPAEECGATADSAAAGSRAAAPRPVAHMAAWPRTRGRDLHHDRLPDVRLLLALILDARSFLLRLPVLLGIPALDRHHLLLHDAAPDLHAVQDVAVVRLRTLRAVPASALRVDLDVERADVVCRDDLLRLDRLALHH